MIRRKPIWACKGRIQKQPCQEPPHTGAIWRFIGWFLGEKIKVRLYCANLHQPFRGNFRWYPVEIWNIKVKESNSFLYPTHFILWWANLSLQIFFSKPSWWSPPYPGAMHMTCQWKARHLIKARPKPIIEEEQQCLKTSQRKMQWKCQKAIGLTKAKCLVKARPKSFIGTKAMMNEAPKENLLANEWQEQGKHGA